MYGKKIIAAVLPALIVGCSRIENEQPELKLNSAQEHIKYIIEDYSFGDNSGYIEKYVDNEYATNEFIIDSIADNFSEARNIESLPNDIYRVETDKETLDITLILEAGKVKKIKVKEAEKSE